MAGSQFLGRSISTTDAVTKYAEDVCAPPSRHDAELEDPPSASASAPSRNGLRREGLNYEATAKAYRGRRSLLSARNRSSFRFSRGPGVLKRVNKQLTENGSRN